MQEMPSEALTRYITRTFFNVSVTWQAIHSKFFTGAVDLSGPQQIPNRIQVVQ